MHPFSVLTLGIFVAGYITARWDLVTRLYELAIFAWENGVVVRLRFLTPLPPTRATKAFAALSVLFLAICAPTVLLAIKETNLVRSIAPSDAADNG
ncbi:hypothetical protein ACHAP7_008057 [Fusarium lateritium]